MKIKVYIRCKDKCKDEAPIQGSKSNRYNARCSHCGKAFNTDNLRCYCCGQKLRRRKSVNGNLKHKEPMIVRIE